MEGFNTADLVHTVRVASVNRPSYSGGGPGSESNSSTQFLHYLGFQICRLHWSVYAEIGE